MPRRSQGPRVVSIGTDSNLLALRQAVLELGGFGVLTTGHQHLKSDAEFSRVCLFSNSCETLGNPSQYARSVITENQDHTGYEEATFVSVR